MCDRLHFFESGSGLTAAALPFSQPHVIQQCAGLRGPMRRAVPAEFSRDEGAYLMNFLAPENLHAPFLAAFGRPAEEGSPSRLVRPRGVVAPAEVREDLHGIGAAREKGRRRRVRKR